LIGGASRRTLAFGLFLFDADLDADADLFVANGHIIPEVDDVDDDISFRQPPHLFMNDGEGRFEDVARADGGSWAQPMLGRGAAFADYDRDGDLDVLVVENGGRAKLLQNLARQEESRAKYLRVRLIGRSPGTSGIGARVLLYADGRRQAAAVKSGSSYLSQSELPLTFGLGRSAKADSLVVVWPSGYVQRLQELFADREILIREPDASDGDLRRVGIRRL